MNAGSRERGGGLTHEVSRRSACLEVLERLSDRGRRSIRRTRSSVGCGRDFVNPPRWCRSSARGYIHRRRHLSEGVRARLSRVRRRSTAFLFESWRRSLHQSAPVTRPCRVWSWFVADVAAQHLLLLRLEGDRLSMAGQQLHESLSCYLSSNYEINTNIVIILTIKPYLIHSRYSTLLRVDEMQPLRGFSARRHRVSGVAVARFC